MIIEVNESFEKDFKKLKNKELEKRIINKLNIIEKEISLENISNIKKLYWFNDLYRLRIWDYRIWFRLKSNKIILLRVRSRKDIYNIFP